MHHYVACPVSYDCAPSITGHILARAARGRAVSGAVKIPRYRDEPGLAAGVEQATTAGAVALSWDRAFRPAASYLAASA
jgi:hypothetical protein